MEPTSVLFSLFFNLLYLEEIEDYDDDEDLSESEDDSDSETDEDEEDECLNAIHLPPDPFIFMSILTQVLTPVVGGKRSRSTRDRDRRIPRIALVSPQVSPWVRLFSSNHNNSLIQFTGFNYASFNYLAVRFEQLYNQYTPYSISGKVALKRIPSLYRRPRSLDSRGCLGLVLAHLRSRGSLNWLSQLFGTTYSVTSLYIRFGRRLLLLVMKDIPGSKVSMPPLGDIREYQRIVESRFPTLTDVWFVLDGLRIILQEPVIGEIQSKYFSGHKKNHNVNNIFTFCPGGYIIACALNIPGCVHDSSLAFMGRVYEKLQNQNEIAGGKGVVDSAFASDAFPFLIKSCKPRYLPTNSSLFIIERNKEAIQLRQSAEWGMRGIKSSFPRLLDKLQYEENGERLLLLRLIVHLFNFRTRYIGYNQIQSVFLPQMREFNDRMYVEWTY
jgi:hypothetical protein